MNIYDSLIYDAEWWVMPIGLMRVNFDNTTDLILNEYCDSFFRATHEQMSWMCLLVAEAETQC